MPGRLEPLHAILTLPRGTMRMLTAVVQRATLAMFHPRQDFTLRRAVALELVRDNHAWDIPQALEQLTKELLRRLLVTATLHQDIEHVIVLVHGAQR